MVERIDDHDVCFKKWAILSLIFVVLNQFLQYKICRGLSEIPTRNIRVESEYADHYSTSSRFVNYYIFRGMLFNVFVTFSGT